MEGRRGARKAMGREREGRNVGGKDGRRKIVVRGVREVWPEEKTSRPLKNSFGSVDSQRLKWQNENGTLNNHDRNERTNDNSLILFVRSHEQSIQGHIQCRILLHHSPGRDFH